MKKSLLLFLSLFFIFTLFAQAPQKLNYQAVVRNSDNTLVKSTSVGMRVSVLKGSTEGTVVYTEEQTPATNSNGLINIEIGGGAGFSSINWADGPYFIKIESDPLGGTNYTITGTSQLLSVPFALHAKTAENGITTELANEIAANTLKVGITAQQASDIIANNAKVGITAQQASDITANNSKVGITTSQATAITNNTSAISTLQSEQTSQNTAIALNTAKVGITTAQANAIIANTAKVGITTSQADAITANTAKVGITAQQASDIIANNAKVGITTAQATAITNNTSAISTLQSEQTTQNTAIALNTAKVGITAQQASDIIANNAKVGITTAQASAIIANTAKVGVTNGTAAGQMQYWNGSAWVVVPVGKPGQFLQLSTSNTPTWSGNAYPSVNTLAATSIEGYSAILGGTISDDGGAAITARGICWKSSPNPSINDNKTSEGVGTGTFSSTITSFNLNTTYYVRAYAINSVGLMYGNEIEFQTPSTSKPILTTKNVFNLTGTTASCGGNISLDGNSSITARGICWSTSENPTISNNIVSGGSGIGEFTCSITGLEISTRYYVRAYATNAVGTSYGEQISFKTIGSYFNIGDDFQGGKLAYFLQPGDPGYNENTPHGLVASSINLSTNATWGNFVNIPGAEGTALGTGYQNTIDIGASGNAAKICSDYVSAPYSDWFLPSLDELNKLYLNRIVIGGFTGTYYWTSSEINSDNAYYQNFSNGQQNGMLKFNPVGPTNFYVRAVRAF